MNKITRSLKAGIKGYKEGVSQSVPLLGRYCGGQHQIRCLQCQHDVFTEQDTGLPGLGTILTCDQCGMSQLYGKKPTRVQT